MANISLEQLNNITVFRVAGTLSFNELVGTIEKFYPLVTGHILWDLTGGEFGEISVEQFDTLPYIINKCMINRVNGKNAYVSSDDKDYGLLRMYQLISRYRSMAHESNVFREMEAALAWLC